MIRVAVLLTAMCGAVYAQSPTQMKQLESNGSTLIPVGGTASGTTVIFKATLTANLIPSPPIQCRLHVEVKAVGTAFDGTGLMSSNWANFPSTFSLTMANIAPGSYKWRCCGEFQSGGLSSWKEYPAGGTPGALDFIIAAPNTDPDPPQTVRLVDPVTLQEIPFGSDWTGSFLVEADVTDPDGDQVGLIVYVSLVGHAYGADPTAESATLAPSGSSISVEIPAAGPGSYKVRVVAKDQFGAVSSTVEANGQEEPQVDIVVPEEGGVDPPPPAGDSHGDSSSGGGCSSGSSRTGAQGTACLILVLLILCAGRAILSPRGL